MQTIMRLSAVLTVGIGVVAGSASANAWGFDPTRAPENPRIERFINHFVYKPRYTHVYHTAPHGDPYAYRYAKRAYYPYHGSRYWVSADQMRYRYRYHWEGVRIDYQPSWGRPRAEHHHAPARPMK